MRKLLFVIVFLLLSISAQAQSTTNLSITKPQPTNTNWLTTYRGFDQFDAAIAGRLSKSVAGSSDVTLTTVEARNKILEFTGTLTGNINVIVPSKNRFYIVYNNTSGAFTLTVKTAAGTGVAVTQATRVQVYCDATNVVSIGGGTPGGSNKQLQYNNAGAFGGASGFEWQNASPNVLITAQNAAHIPLVAKGAASQSANIFQVQDSGGNGLFSATSSGNLESSTDGSSTGSPRTFGFTNLTSGEAARVQFGDPYTAFQSGFGTRMQIYSYWGIEIQGSRQVTSAPSFVNGVSTDPTLSVKTAQGGNETLLIDGTGVEGSNAVPLVRFTKGGQSNNAVEAVLDLINNDTSTTGDTGMGVGVRFGLESSSTDNRDAARLDVRWTDGADASRTSAAVVSTVSNAGSLSEAWRVAGTGTGNGMNETLTGVNGSQQLTGQLTQNVTLNTGGTTTDSTIQLPAGSIILSVTARVTTTITTATDWKLGDATIADRFSDANSTLTAGTTTVGINQWKADRVTAGQGAFQQSAAAVRITTTGTPGAGAIRITIHYLQLIPPTS